MAVVPVPVWVHSSVCPAALISADSRAGGWLPHGVATVVQVAMPPPVVVVSQSLPVLVSRANRVMLPWLQVVVWPG